MKTQNLEILAIPKSWERSSSAEIEVNDTKEKVIHQALSSRSKSCQRKVTFSENIIIYATLHKSKYTKKEKENTWYSKKDLANIKKENQPTVDLMRSCEINNDTEQHCTRGLEHRVYDRALERKGLRLRAKLAVFEAQAVVERKPNKADAIAFQYTMACEGCSFQAHKVGLIDELQAFGPKLTNKIKKSKTRALIQQKKEIRNKRHAQWEMSMLFHEYIVCGNYIE